MAEGRKCCVYLPNQKKLELSIPSKLQGKDLLEIVATHFKLKEKDYFGIAYKSDSGHYSWLQDEKKILDHDVARKNNSLLELNFAVKFYVESVTLLKHCLTVELFFLQIKSLIYKGELEVDSDVAFKLAADVLQISSGDYKDDAIALQQLRKLPVLPSKILQEHDTKHCETCILERYKNLRGSSRGTTILNYMKSVESLPTYGVHFYKVKDKSGIPWWLGLSFKGIFQFDFHDRSKPVKSYNWRQLENLYFREKKFSIEVSERHQRILSSGSKNELSIEPPKKSAETVKVYAWYGSPALIKSIWIMSIAQHHFYLDRKQSKSKLKDAASLNNLSNDLSNNNNSLIISAKNTPVMTQKLIRDVDVTVKKGSKEETPEVRAAKRQLCDALKEHRTELEDKLYDKVQELKKLCLQEADIRGKLPWEYIRYLDVDETPPKIKKRVGAEFQVKLRNKNGTTGDREYPTSVTAASSSSSGFSSEATDGNPEDELSQLEQEVELLTQIANAARKLATDPSAKGRTKTKRWSSYKKAVDKLQAVEDKINALRKKSGQQPSVRASMLIADDDDITFDDGGISLGGGTESERSSLSDGLLLDDESSLSSGGDVLSTHSTPAILNRAPASAIMSRKMISSADVDISDIQTKRSLTPPPSFDRPKIDSDSGTLKSGSHGNHYPLLPSPQSSSGVSMDSNKMPDSQAISTRDWISQKWEVPRPKPNRGWNESSLDSIETTSTTSRQSEEARATRPIDAAMVADKSVDLRSKKPDKLLVERPASANSNQNNHNEVVQSAKKKQDLFNMSKLKREVSDSALSDLSVKSSPVVPEIIIPSVEIDGGVNAIPKEGEVFPDQAQEHFRKRSSSFSETQSHPVNPPHWGPHKTKTGTLKATYQPQYIISPSMDTYNVQHAFATRSQMEMMQLGQMTKSKSSQDLQPPIFDTNVNIRMQYMNKNEWHPSYAAPTANSWDQNASSPGNRLSHPGVLNPELQKDPRLVPGGHASSGVASPPQYYPVAAGSTTYYSPPPGHPYPQFYQDPYMSKLHPSYYYTSQPHHYQQHQPGYITEPPMTTMQRDMYNNEVYQDIGLGWMPSLTEYSSRASVCESASAQSKKEDIRRVLEDHIAMKRTPSQLSAHDRNQYNKQRKMREQYKAYQQQNAYGNQSTASRDKTWADYKKQLAYNATTEQQGTAITSASRSSPSSESSAPRTNIFLHKPPPSASSEVPHPLLYKTQRQPRMTQQKSAAPQLTAAKHTKPYCNTMQHPGHNANSTNPAEWHGFHDLKQRLLFKHYLHHDRVSDPLDHMHVSGYHERSSNPAYHLQRQTNSDQGNQEQFSPDSTVPSDGKKHPPLHNRWMSQPSELKSGSEVNIPTRRSLQDLESKCDWGSQHHSRLTPQPFSFDGVTPVQPHPGVPGQHRPESNPNLVRYRIDQERTRYEQQARMHRKKLSASAEDLLWTGNDNSQAGTLV